MKKKQRGSLDILCAFFLPFSVYNLSMEQRSWHVPRATATQNFSCRMSDASTCIRACTRTCVRVFVYLGCLPFFFPTTTTPGVSPSTGGMLFLTGGGPRPRFFPSLTPPRVCFPRFFSRFFFTGAPIIRRSAFASVSYSFSTDRGRSLLPTAPASTLFHLIKGHKLPYDDGGKKRGKEKKRTYCPQIARLAFSPVVFLAGGP